MRFPEDWGWALWLVAQLVLEGCHPASQRGEAREEGLNGGKAPAVGQSRAEVVAAADHLVVLAQADASAKPQLLGRAANLRERLWRRERRKVDALEAIEQLGSIAEGSGEVACSAAIDKSLLEAEVTSDLEGAYGAVYAVAAASPHRACLAKAEQVLSVLAAYRPNAGVLTGLVRQGGGAETKPSSVAHHGGAAAALAVKPAIHAATGRVGRLTRVEPYGAVETARVVVHLTEPKTFEIGRAPPDGATGPRIFVDLDSVVYDGPSDVDVGGLVKRVRLGKRLGGVRLVLDLEKEAFSHVFYLPEPFRLIIDVSMQPPRTEGKEQGPRRVRRVALDPGHGGHDPGAVGANGLREKDVTLDVAHRAAPLIAQELGVSVLLTRDADVFVPLDERAARANAFRADVFVSIHCNASADAAARGVMTFVLDESQDPLAAHVAARENAASPAAAAELADALGRVMEPRGLAESVRFAELLQRASVASLAPQYSDVRDQGVNRAGFYVLAGAHMPAVLYEVSFVSNDVDEQRLGTGDYRQKLADAIVNATRAFRDGH